MIVTLHADDCLWAEALNLCAYGLLPKPFEAGEVKRSVSIAVLHWRWNKEDALPPLVMSAGAKVP